MTNQDHPSEIWRVVYVDIDGGRIGKVHGEVYRLTELEAERYLLTRMNVAAKKHNETYEKDQLDDRSRKFMFCNWSHGCAYYISKVSIPEPTGIKYVL